MNSKIKKVVCVVLAVLIIAAIVIIAFVIPSAADERELYILHKELPHYDYDGWYDWYEYYKREYAISVTVIVFASLTILSNGFLLFLFLKNSNALEYVKLSVFDIKEMRREKSKAKQEKEKQKLQSKLNEINQKTV